MANWQLRKTQFSIVSFHFGNPPPTPLSLKLHILFEVCALVNNFRSAPFVILTEDHRGSPIIKRLNLGHYTMCDPKCILDDVLLK